MTTDQRIAHLVMLVDGLLTSTKNYDIGKGEIVEVACSLLERIEEFSRAHEEQQAGESGRSSLPLPAGL